ncbi:MAG: PTS fructose transporter subunit IIA, partial [Hyphomicrobium sp.]
MIGIVLITHGRLGAEMLAALEHVVGPQQQAMAIGIGPDDDLDKRRADLLAALAACERGKGVV